MWNLAGSLRRNVNVIVLSVPTCARIMWQSECFERHVWELICIYVIYERWSITRSPRKLTWVPIEAIICGSNHDMVVTAQSVSVPRPSCIQPQGIDAPFNIQCFRYNILKPLTKKLSCDFCSLHDSFNKGNSWLCKAQTFLCLSDISHNCQSDCCWVEFSIPWAC